MIFILSFKEISHINGSFVNSHIMRTIEEIKDAISVLPDPLISELRQWIVEKGWEKWDEQIVRDSESGKLDFLIDEA